MLAMVVGVWAAAGPAAVSAADAGGTASVAQKVASAQAPLPLAEYLKPHQFAQAELSPDGKQLAVLAPIGAKRNLVALDVATLKPITLTNFREFDVRWFEWVGPEWLVFSLGRIDAPTGPESGDGGGLYAIKADGSQMRTLSGTWREQINKGQNVYRGLGFAGKVRGSDNEIYASGNLRDVDAEDLYKINLDTNKQELLTFRHPGTVDRWLLDRNGVPRLAVVRDKAERDLATSAQTRRVLLRDSADGEWREIERVNPGQKDAWSPMTFADNNVDLLVSYRGDRDTSAIYRFDVTNGKLGDLVAAHPRYDLGRDAGGDWASSFVRVDGRVVGVEFNSEYPQVAYFDEELARLQARLDKSFPGHVVEFQRTRSGLMLVNVFSDRTPSIWYLYDEKRNTMRELLRASTTLDEKSLVAMRPFLLKTRDGLEIPSYYFLPASYQPGQKLPVVVHIHGGPMVRADLWGVQGFGVREAQILASRGYAVVLPNFRITPGFGARIYAAGMGQYGRKMSEDHEDAALWAVAQGFADPKRICISGASYGGAAALWATIKSADVFACAVAGLAPSDPKLQNTSVMTDYVYSKSAVADWKLILGVKGDDWSKADEVSAAKSASQSRVPLFMYAGADDYRVPIEQTRLMVDALKSAGRPPEVVMIKSEEGHGYGKLENGVDLYTEMLKFLARHIGVGPTPAASAEAATPGATGITGAAPATVTN